MRLLFILPNLPFPPADGGRAKVFNVLRYLVPRHECDLLCFGDASSSHIAALREQLPAIGNISMVAPPSPLSRLLRAVANLARLRPPSFARYESGEMAARVESAKRTGCYDVVHYDIINMAPYRSAGDEMPSVHSPNDATSLVYRRLAAAAASPLAKLRLRFVSCLLERFECAYYGAFSKIHVVSEADRDYLVRRVPGIDVEVIPISSGYPRDISLAYTAAGSPHGLTVTVCGNLGDAAIAAGFRQFLDHVLPAVSTVHPELRVRILGRRIDAALKRDLRRYPNVDYVAWIPDFEACLSSSDVLLLPDQAGAPGAKTRTVQAMALGRAVLGTQTAFEGIPMTPGQHGMIYTSIEECREGLLRLLGDRSMRDAMGAAAARLAADEYSIECIGPKYESLYRRAQAKPRPATAAGS